MYETRSAADSAYRCRRTYRVAMQMDPLSPLPRRPLRVTLGLFALQMMGTFLVLVVQPDVAFQDGNPLLLTVEGEFVIKNLVLLSACMVVGATGRRRQA